MPNTIKQYKRSKVSAGDASGATKDEEVDEAIKSDGENISLLGHYITKEYELLRLVLSYLPLRDLYAAAQVCKTWQSAVEVIKRSRHARPHWFFWHCKQKELSQGELPYHMFSRHFFSEPQLCLMFMTRSLNMAEINCRRSKAPCPSNSEGKHCNLKHRVLHYVRAELQNCPSIMLEGYGVVGSSHDLNFTAEVENFNAYAGVLLPKTPSVSIKVFHLTKDECLSFNRLKTVGGDEIESFTKLSPTSEPIQCLLLFCKDHYCDTAEKIVAALETRQGNKFAVGGGFYDHINLGSLAPRNQKRSVCLVGIAFTGEGIHAASTVISADVRREDRVSEAMEEFRSCQLPGQDSVAFMFACVGRGVEWYMADNVESASFRQYFPSTPLIGYFGAGEIGHKFFPGTGKISTHQQHDDNSEDDSIILSYTSVFVLLSFNRQGTA